MYKETKNRSSMTSFWEKLAIFQGNESVPGLTGHFIDLVGKRNYESNLKEKIVLQCLRYLIFF